MRAGNLHGQPELALEEGGQYRPMQTATTNDRQQQPFRGLSFDHAHRTWTLPRVDSRQSVQNPASGEQVRDRRQQYNQKRTVNL